MQHAAASTTEGARDAAGEGYVLTNYHVVADGRKQDFVVGVNVTLGELSPTGRMVKQEKTYDGVVVKADLVREMAIVKIKDPPANLKAVKLANASRLAMRRRQRSLARGHRPRRCPRHARVEGRDDVRHRPHGGAHRPRSALLIDADEDTRGARKSGDAVDALLKARKVDAEVSVVMQWKAIATKPSSRARSRKSGQRRPSTVNAALHDDHGSRRSPSRQRSASSFAVASPKRSILPSGRRAIAWPAPRK